MAMVLWGTSQQELLQILLRVLDHIANRVRRVFTAGIFRSTMPKLTGAFCALAPRKRYGLATFFETDHPMASPV